MTKLDKKACPLYISAEKPVSEIEEKTYQKEEYDLLISTDKCSYRWWDSSAYITFPEFVSYFCT